jgi:transposase
LATVARHIRNVPGRKTDVKDAEWIATLVSYGLIQPSFVPPKPLRELRDLLRYRRKLVEGQNTERNRPQKLLETAGIKLGASPRMCWVSPAAPCSGR